MDGILDAPAVGLKLLLLCGCSHTDLPLNTFALRHLGL